MKLLIIFLAAVLIIYVGTAMNSLPSGNITYHAPLSSISLQNVDREAAYNIDAQLMELQKAKPWSIPDLGYKFSETRTEVQGNETVQTLLNFSAELPKNLTSVGDSDSNFTVLNGTIAWF